MDKLEKKRKIKLAALILSAALCVISLVCTALFSLKLWYVPLVICVAIAIASIYAIPFLWFSLKDGKLYTRLILKMEEGVLSLDELSAAVGIKPDALRKIIDKGVEKGYLAADTTLA